MQESHWPIKCKSRHLSGWSWDSPPTNRSLSSFQTPDLASNSLAPFSPSKLKTYQLALQVKENKVRRLQMLEERARGRIENIKERNKVQMTVRLQSLEDKAHLQTLKNHRLEEERRLRETVRECSRREREGLEYGKLAVQIKNKRSAKAVREDASVRRYFVYEPCRNQSIPLPSIRAQYLRDLSLQAKARQRRIQDQTETQTMSQLKARLAHLDQTEVNLHQKLQQMAAFTHKE